MSLSKILTEDFLTCSICLEKFKVPKALSCSHTFCQHCLQDLLERNLQGQSGFPCPLCRRQCDLPVGGVSSLQTNHLVVSISHKLAQVEKAKAAKKCEVCCLKNVGNPPTATKRCLNCEESMCGDCSSEHVLHELNRDHKLFPVDQLGSDEYGDVSPTVSGKLVTSYIVELSKTPKEIITHVTTDTNGDILIGIWCNEDRSRNRIHIYDTTFVLQGTIPNPRAAKKGAFGGIAIDDDGNIVTRCQGSNEIIVYTKTGDHVRTFHSESPQAVAVNSKGHYVVAGRNTLTVHHKDGKILQTTPDPGGKYFKFIHCNMNDDIIVTGDDHIRVYDSTLQLKYRYGTQGDGDGQVDLPCGTCSLDNGDIILTDFFNHRLHLVSQDGKFKQYLLNEDNGLSNPRDVTINHFGKLVVGESGGKIKIFEL